MVACTLDLGVQRDQAANCGESGLGLLVVLVSVVLIVSANALTNDYGDLVVVRGVHAHRTVIVDYFKTGAGREVLLQMVVEIEGLAENVIEIVIVNVDLVANARPVEACRLGRDQSGHNNDYDQKYSGSANPWSRGSLPLRLLVLDQLDHAPQDQEYRPIVSEPHSQPRPQQLNQFPPPNPYANHHQRPPHRTRPSPPS